MMTLEQISATTTAQLETLFNLTNKTFEGMEKIVELNMQAAKASIDESINHTKKALKTKDAHEFLTMQANVIQPIAERAAAYGRQFHEIAARIQSEFTKVAETQLTENSHKLNTFAEGVSQNAPAGSESAVAMLKAAINTTNTACETIYKAVKQAAEITETNIQTAAQMTNKAAQGNGAQQRSKRPQPAEA